MEVHNNMSHPPPLDHMNRPKPITVSSTSSMETAASFHNDASSFTNSRLNVSSEPSLIRTMPVAPQTMPQSNYADNPKSATNLPSSISLVRNPLRSPSTGMVIPSVSSPSAVPEFLYQLTKMLTDNNRDIIEWSNGKIEVHNPHKLQTQVLNRYFRHSKFASFQRQLNYFGFRKLAGKGKMAPCSYVNDATTNELRSLLHIKRKTGNEPKPKSLDKKQADSQGNAAVGLGEAQKNADSSMSGRANEASNTLDASGRAPLHSQQALAQVAVGRGIRHGFSRPVTIKPVPLPSTSGIEPSQTPVQAGLSALSDNFQNSLRQDGASLHESNQAYDQNRDNPSSLSYVPGSLRRDDSLVDLAMIPFIDEDGQMEDLGGSDGLAFIDFPWDPNYS